MAARNPACRIQAQQLCLQLRANRPAVSFGDLCLMLELELALGRKDDFRQRLSRAIASAYRQGMDAPPCKPSRIHTGRRSL